MAISHPSIGPLRSLEIHTGNHPLRLALASGLLSLSNPPLFENWVTFFCLLFVCWCTGTVKQWPSGGCSVQHSSKFWGLQKKLERKKKRARLIMDAPVEDRPVIKPNVAGRPTARTEQKSLHLQRGSKCLFTTRGTQKLTMRRWRNGNSTCSSKNMG